MAFQPKSIITLVTELGVSSQSLLEFLRNHGLEDHVRGEGFGAAVTTEEALEALRNAFAEASVQTQVAPRGRSSEEESGVSARKEVNSPDEDNGRAARRSRRADTRQVPEHVASRIDVIGRGRSLIDAIINDGYGFLIEDGRQYFFHITDLKGPLRRLLDVRHLAGGVGGLSAFLPQPAFDLVESEKGPRAINIRPHPIWEQALVRVDHIDDPEKMRIAMPATDADGLLYADSDGSAYGDGFYTATVWKAIPVLHKALKVTDDRYIVQLRRPFRWDQPIENLEQVRRDEGFVTALVAPFAEEVSRLIAERGARLKPDDVESLLAPCRRRLVSVVGEDTDLASIGDRLVLERVRQFREELDPIVFLYLLGFVSASDFESEFRASLQRTINASFAERLGRAFEQDGSLTLSEALERELEDYDALSKLPAAAEFDVLEEARQLLLPLVSEATHSLPDLTAVRLFSELGARELEARVQAYLSARADSAFVQRTATALESVGDEGFEAEVAVILNPLREALGSGASIDVVAAFASQLVPEVRRLRDDIDPLTYVKLLLHLGAEDAAAEMKAALESAVDQHINSTVIDLESDGTTIWELGLGDGRRFSKYVKAEEIEGALARAADEVDSCVWIGHNLESWDAPIVAERGFDLSKARRWDTLRAEALLSPRRRSFALDTSHHADEDAAVTYRLFRSQVIRLLIDEHYLRDDHVCAVLAPVESELTSIRSLATFLCGNEQLRQEVAALFRSELDELLVTKRVDSMTATLEQYLSTLSADAGVVHVVYPRLLGPELVTIPGLRFADEAGSEWGLEVHSSGPFQEEDGTDPDYESMLAAAYARSCEDAKVAPLLAAMPGWSKAQIALVANRFCQPADPTSKQPDGGSIWCIPSDFYLRSGVDSPAALVLVEPELDSTTNTRVVRQVSKPELYAYLDRQSAWGRLLAAKTFWQLSERQASDFLKVGDMSPSAGCAYWMRRGRTDRWEIIEHVFDMEAAARQLLRESVAIHDVALDNRETGDIGYIHLEAKGANGEEFSTMRLNPETPYRDRYWTMQLLLLERISDLHPDEPIVLLTSGRDELKDIKGALFDAGWYVPEGAVHRQLELLLASRHPRRIAVMRATSFHSILEANTHVDTPLTFVIEAFPLQEQYYLCKRAGESEWGVDQQASLPDDASVDADQDLEVEDEEASDDDAAADASSPLPSRFSIYQAFRQALPQLRLLLQQMRGNHDRHRVVALDPRLEPVAVPDGFPHLFPVTLSAFATQAFENRLLRVQERIRSVQPPLEDDLPENWLEILERIFLAGKGREGEDGTFRPEQRDYLEHIIRRREDVLVVMPTGGGKSVLFQAPALYHGLLTNRMTYVVTPLKALMADQVDALHRLGFLMEVDYVSSDLPRIEVQDVYRRIAGGELIMVYIAPERFRVGGFKRALEHRLHSDGDFAYCVFDEAHCISLWGLDFRPDYMVPVQFVQQKRAEGIKTPCVLLSATVTEQVHKNLAELFA